MPSLTFILVAFFASLLCAFAVPVPELDKRVDHSGRGTWFDVGLGACGQWNVNSDFIVAISHDRWANGGNCEQYVRVTANGVTSYGQTRDECMGCNEDDLDMSPSLFQTFADLSVGVVEVEWNFMEMGWSP